ncbi:MAG: glutamate racemase [Rhizonema sp. NSF051]|nr:glutamate racemase [Rhizonema sp. NSF051]
MCMNPSAPIGVFDSGVGGLSVLRAIRAELPHENLCYIADSGHVPYGTKTPEYLQQRAFELTRFLLVQGAKALVIACNTATVAAVANLRATFLVPIIAVEPAVKPAVAMTKTGIVGVLATAATSTSVQFELLRKRFGASVTILTQACPHLVTQVEAGDLTSPITRVLIEQYTAPLLAAGADTLVLGCTHYPFLRPLIDDIVGPSVTIIDTGVPVTRQLSRVLAAQNLLNVDKIPGSEHFWTSGKVQTTQGVISTLWGHPVTVQPLPQTFA